MTPRKAAVLATNLPAGAQTWVDFGGAMAVTPEAEAVYLLEGSMHHVAWLFGGKNGPAPQVREYPPSTNPNLGKPAAEDKAARWQRREAERQRRLAAGE